MLSLDMDDSKQLYIIAGPNGAGKSSHARITLLPDFLKVNEFVNADEIAKILSPHDPSKSAIRAARLMINRVDFLLSSRRSFALETTLSSKNYLRIIECAKSNGYEVNLLFLFLPNYEFAIDRVRNRVEKGGHNIEKDVVKRRFKRGLENIGDYVRKVDMATFYDSSGSSLIEIANKFKGRFNIVSDDAKYEVITSQLS